MSCRAAIAFLPASDPAGFDAASVVNNANNNNRPRLRVDD